VCVCVCVCVCPWAIKWVERVKCVEGENFIKDNIK
jgi:hypothetical protein